jgi:hypothetical protein
VCFSLVYMDVRTVPHCLARRPSTAALEGEHVRVCDELPILRRRERRSSFLIFPKTVMLWRQEIVWRKGSFRCSRPLGQRLINQERWGMGSPVRPGNRRWVASRPSASSVTSGSSFEGMTVRFIPVGRVSVQRLAPAVAP